MFFFFSQSQRLQLVSWPPSDFQAFTRAVLPHNLPREKLSKFSQSLSKPDFSMVKTTTKKIVTKTPISQEKHSSMHSHKVSARRPFFFFFLSVKQRCTACGTFSKPELTQNQCMFRFSRDLLIMLQTNHVAF